MQIVTYVTYKKSTNGDPPHLGDILHTMISKNCIKCIQEYKMQNGLCKFLSAWGLHPS